MDIPDVSHPVPPPPAPAARLPMFPTDEWGTIRAFMLIFMVYTSILSLYTSGGAPGTIFFMVSSLAVLVAAWSWFGNLTSLNHGGQPSGLLAGWTAVTRGRSRWWRLGVGYETPSARLSSTLMALFGAACGGVTTYSTVTGCYWALGGAATELFAACYVANTVNYHYQHLFFLIIEVDTPTLLPMKTRFQLGIWSAAMALGMRVSSNSINLYAFKPGIVASDAGTFCLLLMISGHLMRAGIGETNISWGVYHVLVVNFVFRTSVLSSLPTEFVAAVFLCSFLTAVFFWDIGRSGSTADDSSNTAIAEPDL